MSAGKHTPAQAHTVACMDSWARTQGLATYSEMNDALRKAADDLDMCSRWFAQAGRTTDQHAAKTAANIARAAIAKAGSAS